MLNARPLCSMVNVTQLQILRVKDAALNFMYQGRIMSRMKESEDKIVTNLVYVPLLLS